MNPTIANIRAANIGTIQYISDLARAALARK
jgi:hypothetical protein